MEAVATPGFERNSSETVTTAQLIDSKNAKSLIKGLLLSSVISGLLLQSAQAAAPIDFSDLVAQVAPAVVRVTVVKKMTKEEQMQQQLPEMLKKFFGNQVVIPNQPKPQTEQKSYGSAFFISEDGYLLTNRHVVDDVKKVIITLSDRRELDADVIGRDERTDVAVLKVKGDHYPSLKMGNSDLLRVGEPVLAIGSPFGFDYSASAGIVSATSRSMTMDSAVPFIQSDVALNPGNSGGPLFNQRGEVIGINSRIFSGTGGYMGLSFSIPIDVAIDIADQLRNSGKVSRSYLGVYPQDIDRNLAEVYHLPKPEGALVTKLSPNSAAVAAGVKEGDIILSFNQQPISRASDLVNFINRTRPNTVVSLGIQRDGKPLILSAKLKPATADDDAEAKAALAENDIKNTLGLKLRDMTEKESSSLSAKGVVIDAVDPDSVADRAQIEVGDVIVRLNNRPTPNIAAYFAAQKSLPKTGVIGALILHDNSPRMVGLRID
ncbi:MAG: Do family serine endopeptidase [Candidatus Saccharibacteria bacterium]|nr:Do family serine endopeptidase [Moraxellaceae bacterium]